MFNSAILFMDFIAFKIEPGKGEKPKGFIVYNISGVMQISCKVGVALIYNPIDGCRQLVLVVDRYKTWLAGSFQK